ncbi:L-threonylcarbamoyladenylate synthase [Flavobacteriaceae bacterium]|nr:L-threonylcarbamoyladenylate synthase [Flavobacteriaceae bacterium]
METFAGAACTALQNGETLLYPTDTIWGIGCDATKSEAIEKIYKLKQREDNKALICLVADLAMLEQLTGPLDQNIKTIALNTKPTTVIYPTVSGLATNLTAANGSVGIRIVQDDFCKKLIQDFGKPIVSTSANISGKDSPKEYNEIDQLILDGVDYIVALRTKKIRTNPSTLIYIEADGTLKTLRA